ERDQQLVLVEIGRQRDAGTKAPDRALRMIRPRQGRPAVEVPVGLSEERLEGSGDADRGDLRIAEVRHETIADDPRGLILSGVLGAVGDEDLELGRASVDTVSHLPRAEALAHVHDRVSTPPAAPPATTPVP